MGDQFCFERHRGFPTCHVRQSVEERGDQSQKKSLSGRASPSEDDKCRWQSDEIWNDRSHRSEHHLGEDQEWLRNSWDDFLQHSGSTNFTQWSMLLNLGLPTHTCGADISVPEAVF